MKGFLSVLNLNFLPKNSDFGLLLLRAGLGLGIVVLHGWRKFTDFDKLAAGFSDPLKIGPKFSLGCTVFAEVVCASLLIIGFCTRFAALVLAFTMGVAFFMVHNQSLSGKTSGEMAALYLLGFVVILIMGPGKFSADGDGGGGGGGGSAGKA